MMANAMEVSEGKPKGKPEGKFITKLTNLSSIQANDINAFNDDRNGAGFLVACWNVQGYYDINKEGEKRVDTIWKGNTTISRKKGKVKEVRERCKVRSAVFGASQHAIYMAISPENAVFRYDLHHEKQPFKILKDDLKRPVQLDFFNDKLYVLDEAKKKIFIITINGTNHEVTFVINLNHCIRPGHFCVLNEDFIIVSDLQKCFRVSTENGSTKPLEFEKKSWVKPSPRGIAKDGHGNILICNYWEGKVEIFSWDCTPIGSLDLGDKSPQFPVRLCVQGGKLGIINGMYTTNNLDVFEYSIKKEEDKKDK